MGAAGTSFYRLPDGGVGGGWPEALPATAEVAAGTLAPPEDFAPTAGIPTCPEPWRRLDDGTCEPVSTDNCTPEARYPDPGAPATGRVVHVHQGATEPPDGTEAAPFSTVVGALAAVSGEVWVRIAPGTYRENLAPRGSVHLLGCHGRVTLEGPVAGQPTVLASGAGTALELQGLIVRGAGVGVQAQGGAVVRVRASEVVGAMGFGVLATAAADPSGATRVELDDCTVEGTRSQNSARDVGVGLLAQEGATVLARRTLLRANRSAGVVAAGRPHGEQSPSRVELTDCVVRDTVRGEGSSIDGVGAFAADGGRVVARRTLFQGNQSTGVFSIGFSGETPSQIDLEDCVVRGTLPRARDGGTGHGGSTQDGGRLTARGTVFQGNHAAAVHAADPPRGEARPTVELTACVLRDTRLHQRDRARGYGIDVERGAVATAGGSLLLGNLSAGVRVTGTASRIELDGCVVRVTGVNPREPASGYGALAERGGEARLTRTLVARNPNTGVLARGEDEAGTASRATLTDCVVQDTAERAGPSAGGFGLSAEFGGLLRASRTLVRRTESVGVYALAEGPSGAASRVELDGCVVRETRARLGEATSGNGLLAQQGAALTARGSLVELNLGAGVAALGVGLQGAPSRVELDGCVVRQTSPRARDQGIGYGVVAQGGAWLTARGTRIEGSHTAGAASAQRGPGGAPSRVELTDCALRDTLALEAPRRLGIALLAVDGGRLDALRVLSERSVEGGAMASGEGTAMTLVDALLSDCAGVDGRGGFGVAAAGGARVEVLRGAVLRSHGAALAALPITLLRGSFQASALVVRDGFVQGVAPGALDYDLCLVQSAGQPRAYGVYVGSAAAVTLQRVTVLDGDTAAASFGGSFTWSDGAAQGFRRYLVRGSSAVTPPFTLERIGVPDGRVHDDPGLTNERLPEPVLGEAGAGRCGLGP